MLTKINSSGNVPRGAKHLLDVSLGPDGAGPAPLPPGEQVELCHEAIAKLLAAVGAQNHSSFYLLHANSAD